MRRRFFVDSFEANSATLRGEAAEHLGRVLRAEPGQLFELSDGERVWLARVESVALAKRGNNCIRFALVEPIPASEPLLRMELLLSIVKFDRFEWCLEKATELGVTEIIPLAAARTDKPLLASAAKRHARWEKILLESAQQSRRLRPPTIHPAIHPEEAFARSTAKLRLVLSEERSVQPLRAVLSAQNQSAGPQVCAALAIGPEGGWTEGELSAARAAGFEAVSLGENILRTETAVLASLAVIRFALEA
jgi:16S rRNA (uracil1498-N3)-methyltransferase